jgi:hypothetical protein
MFPAGRIAAMGTIKAIIGFLAIIGVIYAGYQVIPPELTNYSFQDDLRQVAMTGGASPNKSDEDIRTMVLSKARDHQISLTGNQVTVQRINTPGLSAVYVAADYSVPVSLPGYSFNLHFTPSSENKGF